MSLSWKQLAILAFAPSCAQVSWGQQSSALRGTSKPEPLQVLVIDAGSSGTRIHVFDFLPATIESTVPRIDMDVRERQTKKITPGLSSVADDAAEVEKNIQQLLEFATPLVSVERRSSTPVLFLATAGLRAVEPAQKAAILQCVRNKLEKSEYFFKPHWARILEGNEEAGLAWVAANYLQGIFQRRVPSGASSLGVVEMGGGSTQVAFEANPTDALPIAENDIFTFETMAGTSYQLYAHSYLNYGQDYAQKKMRAMTVESDDPCYPSGYFRRSEDDEAKFIQGTGRADSCQELLKSRLLAPAERTAPGRYIDERALRGQFVAIANFFYVRNDLKLAMDGSIEAMRDAAQTGCKIPLNASEEHAAAMDPLKPNRCFGLCYHVVLLEALRAFMLPGVKVEITQKINGGEPDWALGAALKHVIDSRIEALTEANAAMKRLIIDNVSVWIWEAFAAMRRFITNDAPVWIREAHAAMGRLITEEVSVWMTEANAAMRRLITNDVPV